MPLEPMPELLYLYCAQCESEQPAETPPCADGHGDLCPDRACTACGTAMLFDARVIQLITPRRSRRAA